MLDAALTAAPFLARHLERHPEWRKELEAEDLAAMRDEVVLRARTERILAAGSDPVAALRLAKYYELLRITVRDCTLVSLDDSGETLAELSLLADVLLDHALEVARNRTRARHGSGRWRDEHGAPMELGFAVLGLGKLGSEELNYSSDVDLVYVHESPRAEPHLASEGADVMPAEYFTRLAQEFGNLVSAITDDGFLYRVDLELRPEGKAGATVVSEVALADYYGVWADTWEKAAFMKARPVAGDRALGWRAIEAVGPMIFRSTMDYGAVEGLRTLKARIEQAHGREPAFNVKIDSGGIRDIEFIAQALQLLHGGRMPQVRSASTQSALERLADVRLLDRDRARLLLSAYRFLRRVENRLQMVEERQTHRLPKNEGERDRLARGMGLDDWEGFTTELELHRANVVGAFQPFFSGAGAERILDLFVRNAPYLVTNTSSRGLVEDLAGQFAREIDGSGDDERALNNLDRFVAAVGRSRFYFELLMDRPELVPRLCAMFATSDYLSEILSNHPRLIEPVFADPNTLLLTRDQLEEDLDGLLDQAAVADGDPAEGHLAALRLFHHRQVLNVGLLDLAGHVGRSEVEAALTEIAEVCVARGLSLARTWLDARRTPPAGLDSATFQVIGMGKLASREFGYGSDLDLIFLFDPGDADLPEAQEHFTRLAQRLISLLQTKTREGRCYEVDARLRPSGNQGPLVTSLSALRRYHERDAALWERQILLRARPTAGDPSLAERFEALRRDVLTRPLPDDVAAEISRVRARMETELARETSRRRDYKLGRGGTLDVESVVQLAQLRCAREHAELLDVVPLAEQLANLRRLHVLSPADSDVLGAGWDFLQRLGSRLRIVENRSISDLDEERGDLDGVARRLGYAGTGREGSAKRELLTDYRRHTEAVRAVYARSLGGAAYECGS